MSAIPRTAMNPATESLIQTGPQQIQQRLLTYFDATNVGELCTLERLLIQEVCDIAQAIADEAVHAQAKTDTARVSDGATPSAASETASSYGSESGESAPSSPTSRGDTSANDDATTNNVQRRRPDTARRASNTPAVNGQEPPRRFGATTVAVRRTTPTTASLKPANTATRTRTPTARPTAPTRASPTARPSVTRPQPRVNPLPPWNASTRTTPKEKPINGTAARVVPAPVPAQRRQRLPSRSPVVSPTAIRPVVESATRRSAPTAAIAPPPSPVVVTAPVVRSPVVATAPVVESLVVAAAPVVESPVLQAPIVPVVTTLALSASPVSASAPVPPVLVTHTTVHLENPSEENHDDDIRRYIITDTSRMPLGELTWQFPSLNPIDAFSLCIRKQIVGDRRLQKVLLQLRQVCMWRVVYVDGALVIEMPAAYASQRRMRHVRAEHVKAALAHVADLVDQVVGECANDVKSIERSDKYDSTYSEWLRSRLSDLAALATQLNRSMADIADTVDQVARHTKTRLLCDEDETATPRQCAEMIWPSVFAAYAFDYVTPADTHDIHRPMPTSTARDELLARHSVFQFMVAVLGDAVAVVPGDDWTAMISVVTLTQYLDTLAAMWRTEVAEHPEWVKSNVSFPERLESAWKTVQQRLLTCSESLCGASWQLGDRRIQLECMALEIALTHVRSKERVQYDRMVNEIHQCVLGITPWCLQQLRYK